MLGIATAIRGFQFYELGSTLADHVYLRGAKIC